MAAGQFGNPVPLVVLMEPGDGPLREIACILAHA
jgi:hypothetical protein